MDKELRELIASGEGYHLEFKEALDKSIVEEACAFANSGGGIILVGIRDDGTIKGIETDNRNRSILQDYLRVIQPNLPITIEAIDSIFLIRIPQGTEKPYACPKGFYIRNGANTQKLTRNEIIEFFQKEGR
jgi:ATP-dependent DNA helicase RecG